MHATLLIDLIIVCHVPILSSTKQRVLLAYLHKFVASIRCSNILFINAIVEHNGNVIPNNVI